MSPALLSGDSRRATQTSELPRPFVPCGKARCGSPSARRSRVTRPSRERSPSGRAAAPQPLAAAPYAPTGDCRGRGNPTRPLHSSRACILAALKQDHPCCCCPPAVCDCGSFSHLPKLGHCFLQHHRKAAKTSLFQTPNIDSS